MHAPLLTCTVVRDAFDVPLRSRVLPDPMMPDLVPVKAGSPRLGTWLKPSLCMPHAFAGNGDLARCEVYVPSRPSVSPTVASHKGTSMGVVR